VLANSESFGESVLKFSRKHRTKLELEIRISKLTTTPLYSACNGLTVGDIEGVLSPVYLITLCHFNSDIANEDFRYGR
jgi:hypothetical protein